MHSDLSLSSNTLNIFLTYHFLYFFSRNTDLSPFPGWCWCRCCWRSSRRTWTRPRWGPSPGWWRSGCKCAWKGEEKKSVRRWKSSESSSVSESLSHFPILKKIWHFTIPSFSYLCIGSLHVGDDPVQLEAVPTTSYWGGVVVDGAKA